jgi:hypothetical protein
MARSAANVRDLLSYAAEHRVSIATAAQKLKASDAIREHAKDLRVAAEDANDSLDYWETVSEALSKIK